MGKITMRKFFNEKLRSKVNFLVVFKCFEDFLSRFVLNRVCVVLRIGKCIEKS